MFHADEAKLSETTHAKTTYTHTPMVTFAIILFTLGLLALPFGRVYATWLKKARPATTTELILRKIRRWRRGVNLVLCGSAIIILLILAS